MTFSPTARNGKAPHSGGVPKSVGRQWPMIHPQCWDIMDTSGCCFFMNFNVLESRTLVLKVVPFTLTFAIARRCCVTASDSDCFLLQ